MLPMATHTPLDVCRAVSAGIDCIGVLLLTYGRDAINKASSDGLLVIAPRVTLTKWGERLLRDNARDILERRRASGSLD